MPQEAVEEDFMGFYRHVFVKYDQDLKTELGLALTSSKSAEGNRLQKEWEAGCHLNSKIF